MLQPLTPPKAKRVRIRRRVGIARTWVALVLVVGGGMALNDGIAAQRQPVVARDSGSLAETVSTASIKPVEVKPLPMYLGYSEPTTIKAPTVGIDSAIITVGKTADGQFQVPEYPNFDKAAWYRYSPTPGQYGASIIVGHVDSYSTNGASVFFNLPKLKLGDPVSISRADGSVARFVVRATRTYVKTAIPDDIIYKPVTDTAELRLITCSGNFVRDSKGYGAYDSNTVIFATLQP